MSWFDFLFQPRTQHTGVLDDPRSEDAKNKDWVHEERTGLAALNPFANQQTTESPYFYENQNRTFSCVPHAVGLSLAIERKADTGQYVRIAQMFPYRLRSNFNDEGSYPQNIADIYKKYGAPLFTTLPTPQSEQQANAIVLNAQEYTEAEIFKGSNYWTIKNNFNDIDTLASIAQDGHGVYILIYGLQDEWGRDYPIIQDLNLKLSPNTEIRHAVCVLPKSGFIKDGIKYITIQDSAWFGAKKIRHLSEDWVKRRVYAAGYWDKVVELEGGSVPKYTFTKTLKYGATGSEVKALQQLLISERLLPANCLTGAFYGRTLAALHAFQNKYADEILLPLKLDAPTDIWGAACIAKANKLCS